MTDGNNGSWKVKQAVFQGYVKASLENMDKKFDKIDNRFDKVDIKLENNSHTIERIKIKVGIIAGVAGIVFATTWNIIKRFF